MNRPIRCVECDRVLLGAFVEYEDGPVCPDCDDDAMREAFGLAPRAAPPGAATQPQPEAA